MIQVRVSPRMYRFGRGGFVDQVMANALCLSGAETDVWSGSAQELNWMICADTFFYSPLDIVLQIAAAE